MTIFTDPGKFTSELKRDRLILAATNLLPNIPLSPEYVYEKLLAAEADAQRQLRVQFVPTAYFPTTPTSDQIAALTGMPWAEDPAYDYDPNMFQGDNWSFIQLRNKPLISVTSMQYNYPSENGLQYNIPSEWFKMDKKYGQLRLVPSSNLSLAMLSGFIIQMIGAGRVIPHILNITYVAGLTDVFNTFPDVIDLVKKMAVLRIIEDAYLPQSGSISADGLSQSMSVDMDKYAERIDVMINGRAGSNGGLKAAIHGIRSMVM